MKKILKTIIKSVGYEIIKNSEFSIIPNSTSRPSPSINLIGLAIDSLVVSGLRPTMLQIGAADGSINDPVFKYIKDDIVDALLIEPVPSTFKRLIQTYSGQTNVNFENCAIDIADGYRKFFTVNDDGSGKESFQLASFDKKHIIDHGILNNDIIESEVPCLTISSVCSKHKIDQIDILQVDAEGFDDQIVKMAVNSACLPSIINFEHINLSAERHAMICIELVQCGYDLAYGAMDTLACRKSVFSAF